MIGYVGELSMVQNLVPSLKKNKQSCSLHTAKAGMGRAENKSRKLLKMLEQMKPFQWLVLLLYGKAK